MHRVIFATNDCVCSSRPTPDFKIKLGIGMDSSIDMPRMSMTQDGSQFFLIWKTVYS